MSLKIQFIDELKEFDFSPFKKGNLKVTLTIVLTILIISIFYPKENYTLYDYKINDITKETIIAPFDFPILKTEEELKRDRTQALEKVNFVFKIDRSVRASSINDFDTLMNTIYEIVKALDKLSKSKELLAKSRFSKNLEEIKSIVYRDSIKASELVDYLKVKFAIDTSTSYIKYLMKINKEAPNYFEYIRNKCREILGEIYTLYIIDIDKSDVISTGISIIEDGEESEIKKENVFSLSEIWAKLKIRIQEVFLEQSTEVINYIYDVLVKFIRPNLTYSKEITEKRQQESISKVPISKGIILKDEKIVDANVRITPDIYRKLESLAIERARRSNLKGGIRKELPLIGDPVNYFLQVLLITISYLIFIAFILIYRPEIIKSFKYQFLICLIFVVTVIIAYIFSLRLKISYYAIPVTLSALLFTILFDGKIAFAGLVSLVFILTFQNESDASYMITSIFAGIMAIYSVRRLRSRGQVFQSIIFIWLAYLIGISITFWLKNNNGHKLLNHLLYGSLNSVITPFLAYGIIGLIEVAFGITTALTLLEYANFDNPVLKLLSKHAPGTFTHSIIVGNLAEAAADAIGANSLLARVGAYYHDIGKITKPEYFVENTKPGENKHEKLSPKMSAMIIRNHVKEGARLAEEYGLPDEIKQFIVTHHGNMRIEFFLRKALDIAGDGKDINEDDFRYQGELPTTKETGIVMICDSIEAAIRSLKNPTIQSMEKMVDQIIKERIDQGQLDNCPLTLNDLNKIKGDIKKNTGIMPLLVSIHHVRVEYPEKEKLLE
ncbi:MAG: HDIG domain-containing protein [Candidatus Marinimicrobia bacterium]|nr:HDIG domain-containing protein [Candidatus Neomarinimicrobiota bacterium]